MRDILANLTKLPPYCYGVIDDHVVTIARGARQCVQCSHDRGNIDSLNQSLGVTRAQRLAMECGITFGWGTDAADPDVHAGGFGEPQSKFCLYTVSTPYVRTVQVMAGNETDALRLAELVVGEYRKDGPSMVTEIENAKAY